MPTSARVMKIWCIDVTWCPAGGSYTPTTFTKKVLAAADQSAQVTAIATAFTQDMNSNNPVTLSAPYLANPQDWS